MLGEVLSSAALFQQVSIKPLEGSVQMSLELDPYNGQGEGWGTFFMCVGGRGGGGRGREGEGEVKHDQYNNNVDSDNCSTCLYH